MAMSYQSSPPCPLPHFRLSAALLQEFRLQDLFYHLSLLSGEQGFLLILDTGILPEQRTGLGTWKCSINVHLLNRAPHRTNTQQMLDVGLQLLVVHHRL